MYINKDQYLQESLNLHRDVWQLQNRTRYITTINQQRQKFYLTPISKVTYNLVFLFSSKQNRYWRKYIYNMIDLFTRIFLLLKKNIARRDRESFMVKRCITMLEVCETLQSGFFFDYNNDETWTIKNFIHARTDDGETWRKGRRKKRKIGVELYFRLFFDQVWSSIGSFYCLLALCDYICFIISSSLDLLLVILFSFFSLVVVFDHSSRD